MTAQEWSATRQASGDYDFRCMDDPKEVCVASQLVLSSYLGLLQWQLHRWLHMIVLPALVNNAQHGIG